MCRRIYFWWYEIVFVFMKYFVIIIIGSNSGIEDSEWVNTDYWKNVEKALIYIRCSLYYVYNTNWKTYGLDIWNMFLDCLLHFFF